MSSPESGLLVRKVAVLVLAAVAAAALAVAVLVGAGSGCGGAGPSGAVPHVDPGPAARLEVAAVAEPSDAGPGAASEARPATGRVWHEWAREPAIGEGQAYGASQGADDPAIASGECIDAVPTAEPPGAGAALTAPESGSSLTSRDQGPAGTVTGPEDPQMPDGAPAPSGGERLAAAGALRQPGVADAASDLLDSAQGVEHTWHDGDAARTVRLQVDLVSQPKAAVRDDDIVAADQGDTSIVRRREHHADGSVEPVFRSPSGQVMTLPGGVLLALDPSWDQSRIDGFFRRNSIESQRVSVEEFAVRGFFVDTEPGLASLELANSLAGQEGVLISSPNWRMTAVDLR